MKVVSNFVREQQRYTKNQLKALFQLDELAAEEFIKRLKAYGILKTVANNGDQRDLTDLSDGDIQIMDESAGNDECLYVFTYVGILTVGNRIIKAYPKYILSDNSPLRQMKQIVRVLEKYSHSEEQIINLFNGEGDNRSFNLLGIVLFLLHDYYEHGVYNNMEEITEVNGEGNILWEKTINDGFVIIEEDRPYYTEIFTRRSIIDETDYFRRLHECILTECSKQLEAAGLSEVFEIDPVNLSEEELSDFGDTEYILENIIRELNTQFNTHGQLLLKTIYTYVAQNKKLLEDGPGISMFGTTSFHVVWEKTCAEVFGNKLNTAIGQLAMPSPLQDGYDRKQKLIDLIEKPIWEGNNTINYAKDTLIPDIITVGCQNGESWFIILDAKYYVLQLEKGKPLRGNPGIEDITKQYIYQLAYQKFIQQHHIKTVKNCFLMPTEKNEILAPGTAELGILTNLGLEKIQIRFIPANAVFSAYLAHKQISIEMLDL